MNEFAAVITAFSLFLLPVGAWGVKFGLAINSRLKSLEKANLENEGDLQMFRWCLRLLVLEVKRLDPAPRNAIIEQVGLLLDSKYPLEHDLPPDMQALLDALDKPRRKGQPHGNL